MRADQYAREFGLPAILLGSGREYRLVDRVAALNRPLIIPVNFPKAPNVSTPEIASNVTLQDMMHWELAPEIQEACQGRSSSSHYHPWPARSFRVEIAASNRHPTWYVC